MAESAAGKTGKRVAVIAVHGVADQPPHETARGAAEMLLRRGRKGLERPPHLVSIDDDAVERAERQEAATYEVECECGLSIPVEPVRCGRVETRDRTFRHQMSAGLTHHVQEGRLRELETAATVDDEAPPEDVDEILNRDEMREQLQDYAPEGADTSYRTIRIALDRREGGRVDRVDVYEMYWADLSRLGDKLLGVFFDFYGLLFSLCRLGGASLDRAVGHARSAEGHERSWPWRWSAFWHHTAEPLLVLVIPILNLTVLAMVSVLIARWAERQDDATLFQWAIDYWFAVLVAVGLALLLYARRYRGSAAGKWPFKLGIPILIAVGLVALEVQLDVFTAAGFAFFLWIVAAALLLWLCAVWERRRAGALLTGLVCIGGMTLFLGWQLLYGQAGVKAANVQETFSASVRAASWVLGHPPEGTALNARVFGLDEPEQVGEKSQARADCQSVLEQIERGPGQVGVLGVVWGAFFLFTIIATLLAAVALGRATPDDWKRVAKRAAWTAHLTLVLPGFVVLVVNISLWQALVWIASRDLFGTILLGPADHCVVKVLAEDGILPSLHTAIAAAGLAILMALWFILPAAASEGESKKVRGSHDPSRVRWLGKALGVSFPSMRVSGEIFRVIMVLFLPLIIGLDIVVAWLSPAWAETPWVAWLLERKAVLITWMGIAVFIAVTGSRGFARALALGFRNGLDIALDVANWLKLDPRKSTPRARICARYASLLRYVATRGYDGVVIVAHSQGTVITADLLRFLKAEGWSADPALERLFDRSRNPGTQMHLFTMGSPLRQLYGRRLPFRYGWARARLGTPEPGPRAEDLGVVSWSNAYRSGDYIGRHLWPRDDPWAMRWVDPDAPGDPQKPDRNSRQREKCIGLGGHVHYMDDTAPEIGAEMDRLIRSV